ncbi:hypothetical protein CAL7716_063580 [Calothrix sp. PCC 7716]|nr:hypothetical protein CAL7716_063580 [Calothrix sp. PCC 7716]
MLQNREPEVRYAALEAISYALDEVKIGDEVLAEAKNLLKNEESAFVREYLESLLRCKRDMLLHTDFSLLN